MNNDLISRSALLEELKEWYDEAKQREEANYEWETVRGAGGQARDGAADRHRVAQAGGEPGCGHAVFPMPGE